MIELDLTPTALIQRSGGFVTAGVAGQTVQLRARDEWQGLRLNLRFSDGWHVRDVTAGSDGSAEIPLDVISAPWRSLSMSVAGFDAAGQRALGPIRCKLGYTLPEGTQTGGGSGGADLSSFLTKSEAQRSYALKSDIPDDKDYATREEINAASASLETMDEALSTLRSAVSNHTTSIAALVARPQTSVACVSNVGSWGSESTVTVAQTGGDSLQLVKRVDRDGAGTKTTMTLDGVQLATAEDIPDVSGFITRADMEAYIESLDGTNVGF